MDELLVAALLGATVTTGLMAGIFYAFSCAVMPGLRQSDDRTLVMAMQRINVAILNGWFLLVFGGALVLTAATVVLSFASDGRPALPWSIGALVLYAATLGVTFRVNVPLNDELVAAGDPDGRTDLALVRQRFERSWVRWNIVRTLTCTAAFGSLCWALVLVGRA